MSERNPRYVPEPNRTDDYSPEEAEAMFKLALAEGVKDDYLRGLELRLDCEGIVCSLVLAGADQEMINQRVLARICEFTGTDPSELNGILP